ncbi:restriction endonuclease subunit S [Vibrio parahaemolyticus]|uniref:restriction endonuclease subunit S n=1 Tax=Vibrio parahaemolyticus TaxID=670 RepID=UPI00387B6667
MMDSLKNHISKISKGATPANVMNSREHESDVLFLKSGNVGEGSLVLKELSYISKKDHELLSRSSLKNNDVLLSIAGGIGKVAVIKNLNEQANTNQANAFIRTLPSLRPEYLSIAFQSSLLKEQFAKETVESAIQNLSMGQIQNVKLNVPSIERQDKVIESISKKFLLLNNFINSLTQKLHHIEEYKTALIHNAVTKGLDANNCRILDGTPAEDMKWKDSGIEWIGDIPDGWKLIKLKDYFNVTMGETILKEDLSDESFGIPVYSATKEDVVFGYVNNASKLLNPGDIVIAARGNSIGNPNIISALSTSTQTTIQLNKKRKVNSEFIKYWMLGSHDEIFKFDNTAIPQFTVDDSKNIVSVMPGSDETLRICNYLSKKLEVLKVSKETINKKIALLLEYKKSLINEAVSGQ